MMGRRPVLVAAVVAMALTLGACSGGDDSPDDEVPGTPLTLTVAAGVDNNTLDPAQLSGGARDPYWTAVHDTVLLLDADAKIQPNLASEWSYDDSRTELTLTIVDGAKFADGTPIDAAAIKANFDRLQTSGGTCAYMMANVAAVIAPDAATVVVEFDQPDPAFLGYLTTMGGAIGNPADFDDPDLALTGGQSSGPYVLEAAETQTGSKYVYTRNPNYRDPDAFPFDTYIVLPMADTSARLNALKSGQVDSALLEPKTAQEATDSGLEIATQGLDWVGLFLTDREGQITPAMADVRVRQAINHAIDADGILQSISLGMGTRSTQIFSLNGVAHNASLDDAYPYDPEKAMELLAEAGYPDGFDLTLPNTAFMADIKPFIEQQLGAVGIRVTWEEIQGDEYTTEAKKPRWSAFFMQLASQEPWRDIEKVVTVGSQWNTFGVIDPELQSLIDEARVADEADFGELMQQISTWLVENAYFAPWYFIDTVIASNPDTVSVFPQPWQVTPSIRNYTPAAA